MSLHSFPACNISCLVVLAQGVEKGEKSYSAEPVPEESISSIAFGSRSRSGEVRFSQNCLQDLVIGPDMKTFNYPKSTLCCYIFPKGSLKENSISSVPRHQRCSQSRSSPHFGPGHIS